MAPEGFERFKFLLDLKLPKISLKFFRTYKNFYGFCGVKIHMAPEGFEPPTPGLKGQCSNQAEL